MQMTEFEDQMDAVMIMMGQLQENADEEKEKEMEMEKERERNRLGQLDGRTDSSSVVLGSGLGLAPAAPAAPAAATTTTDGEDDDVLMSTKYGSSVLLSTIAHVFIYLSTTATATERSSPPDSLLLPPPTNHPPPPPPQKNFLNIHESSTTPNPRPTQHATNPNSTNPGDDNPHRTASTAAGTSLLASSFPSLPQLQLPSPSVPCLPCPATLPKGDVRKPLLTLAKLEVDSCQKWWPTYAPAYFRCLARRFVSEALPKMGLLPASNTNTNTNTDTFCSPTFFSSTVAAWVISVLKEVTLTLTPLTLTLTLTPLTLTPHHPHPVT